MGSFLSRTSDADKEIEEDGVKVVTQSQPEYSFKPFVFEEEKYESAEIPKPRSGHRIVSTATNVYSFGGYNPAINYREGLKDPEWMLTKPLFRELWKYNMASRKWTKVPALGIPLILASNAVVLNGSIMLVYGGTGVPVGGHSSNTLYVCDLKEPVPEFKGVPVKGEMPIPQYGQAAFVHKKYLYVIGGTTGYDFSCDVHKLYIPSGTWEIAHLNQGYPPDPRGRYRHELGIRFNDGKVFVFGGGTADDCFGFQEIPVFDLNREVWSTEQTIGDPDVDENNGYPLSRRFHSLVQPTGSKDVYITGGEAEVVSLEDSWKINLETLQWKRIYSLDLPSSLYFHASTLSPQGKLYVFGGITWYSRTSTMWSAWLGIPKLQEICWEAVIYYRMISGLPKDALRQIIPPNFIKRLD